MTESVSIGMKDPEVSEGNHGLRVKMPTSELAFLYSHQRETGTTSVKTHFILMKLPEIVQLSHTP